MSTDSIERMAREYADNKSDAYYENSSPLSLVLDAYKAGALSSVPQPTTETPTGSGAYWVKWSQSGDYWYLARTEDGNTFHITHGRGSSFMHRASNTPPGTLWQRIQPPDGGMMNHMLGGVPLFCSMCHCPISGKYRHDLTGRTAHIDCLPEPSDEARRALSAVLSAVAGTAKPMAVPPDDTAELVALLQLARNNMHKMFECEADERDVQVCLSRIDAAIAIRAPANTDSERNALDTKLSERKA